VCGKRQRRQTTWLSAEKKERKKNRVVKLRRVTWRIRKDEWGEKKHSHIGNFKRRMLTNVRESYAERSKTEPK